jgi:hypothetical protein
MKDARMGKCQPVALRASARNVSIAADDPRLVSSSVERGRLNEVSFLQLIMGRRKPVAFDHLLFLAGDPYARPVRLAVLAAWVMVSSLAKDRA